MFVLTRKAIYFNINGTFINENLSDQHKIKCNYIIEIL